MSRTGLAIAALSVAVSATLGVDIMIGSFRHSVDDWLGKTLRSDLYITLGETDPTGRSNPAIIEPQWLQQLSAIDGVDAISTGLATDVSTQVDTFQMLVLEPSAHSESSYEWMNATPDSAWSTFLNTPSVLISEPLANKHHLAAGATIDIFTELNGNVPFNIAAHRLYRCNAG